MLIIFLYLQANIPITRRNVPRTTRRTRSCAWDWTREVLRLQRREWMTGMRTRNVTKTQLNTLEIPKMISISLKP